MSAPPGHALGEFIHNPAGRGAFPNLPGDFEVPSGAFAYGGSIFIFYTTVTSPTLLEMKGSYLAAWRAPSTGGPPAYDVLYAIDERFDASGPLGGDFINIAAEVSEPYVYLFGTGAYRQSPIHLARKRLDTLGTPGWFERFDAASRTWRPPGDPAAPSSATWPIPHFARCIVARRPTPVRVDSCFTASAQASTEPICCRRRSCSTAGDSRWASSCRPGIRTTWL